MGSKDDERLINDDPNFPPERGKRYGVSCDARTVGSYDTLEEAWDAWQQDMKLVLPVLKKTQKRAYGRYEFRDASKVLSFQQFRMAREKELKAKLARKRDIP